MFLGGAHFFVSDILRHVETTQIGGVALHPSGFGQHTLFARGLREEASRGSHKRASSGEANVGPPAMSLGSPSRAAEDSLRFILKRRLPRKSPADHMRYIELEAARIVETLRHLRDEYRKHLEDQGCSPLAEMYWVVARYGVKDWAVMVLRSAALDYVAASMIGSLEATLRSLRSLQGPLCAT
jgi:hypothetical protein